MVPLLTAQTTSEQETACDRLSSAALSLRGSTRERLAERGGGE